MNMTAAAITRTQQRAQTRQDILAAARRVFEARGFVGASTQDVAREAGVSHGSVFAHFGARDALISAVVDDAILAAETITRQRLKGTRSIGEVLKGHLEGLIQHEEIYARIVVERPFLPEAVQARIVEINAAVASHIFDALTSSGFAKSLKVEPRFAFNTWLALIHHYLMNRDLFAPSDSVLTVKGGELIQNYLAMIRA
jgi:AcrR family transcriptional regulator